MLTKLNNFFITILNSKQASSWVFLFFLLLSFSMRFFSFSRSVIDWDESTYVLIAQALLKGKVLYKDIWDTKPPGIFLLFASVQYFFENSIYVIRFLAMFFVSGTAFFLFKIGTHFYPKNNVQSFFVGIFYISLISFNGFSFAISRGLGLEANTEIFFIFFTVVGFYLYFISKKQFSYLFLSGLAFGVAFIIKYFVLFDVFALGCIILLQHFSLTNEKKLPITKKIIATISIISIGVLLPFFATIAYFYFTNNFNSFWHVTYEVGKRYASEFSLLSTLKFLGDFIYLIGILSLCLFWVIIHSSKKTINTHKEICYWFIWFVFSLFGACYSGKNFYHYLYPVFPAVSLITAYIFSENYFRNVHFLSYLKKGVVVLLFASIPVVGILKMNKLFNKPDYPKLIAKHIGNETLFVDNYYHIVHYYNGTLPLTSYYHPSLLYKPDHLHAIGINQKEETEKIFNQQPTFVLCKKQPSSQIVQDYLMKDYFLEKTFGNEVLLFKKK